MTYQIAVCDDNHVDSDYMTKLIRAWADGRQILVSIETFPSSEAFLFRYAEKKSFDILLLDIEMGAMDGVALARQIRQDNETIQILFVTGYSDYIAQGYDVAALHYLLKPVNTQKLFSLLDRAVEKKKEAERFLILELSGEMIRIPFYEIRYLDVIRNYVTVHGREDYKVKRTLTELEQELDTRFFRVGRSLILNLNFIRRVTKTQVLLSDQTLLPLPRGAYEPLNRAIITFT